jgi:hypothetical protein
VVFAQAADKAMAGHRFEKSLTRFTGDALAAMSRVFARESAHKVALDGSRWVAGALEPNSPVLAGLDGIPADAIRDAQGGLVADMDRVADVLYGRTTA